MRVPVHARVGSLCEAPLVAMVTLIVSGLQTANGNVEAKVVCFYRRRDISSTLIALADKHASEWPTITQPAKIMQQTKLPTRTWNISFWQPSAVIFHCKLVVLSHPIEQDFPEQKNTALLLVWLDCKLVCTSDFIKGWYKMEVCFLLPSWSRL